MHIGFFFGLVFCISEICIAGYFLSWLGISSIFTAFFTYLLPSSIIIQSALFSVFFLAAFFVTKLIRKNHDTKTSSFINEYEDKLIGTTVTLQTPIKNGIGHIKINDTLWKVNGPDAEAGLTVEVIEIRNNALIVTPFK